MRINVFLVRAGVATSRRKADEILQSGSVAVNGSIAKKGQDIDPLNDNITIHGKQLRMHEGQILLALNKPRGYASTRQDPHETKTVYDLLPKESAERVHNIGRLDKDSSGLLLFTNDGAITQRLTHPSNEHEKEYEVTVVGALTENDVQRMLKKNPVKESTKTPKIRITSHNPEQGTTTVHIILREGKKRQIRRMFEAIHYPVKQLIRTRIGNLKLGKLKEKEWRHIKEQEIEEKK